MNDARRAAGVVARSSRRRAAWPMRGRSTAPCIGLVALLTAGVLLTGCAGNAADGSTEGGASPASSATGPAGGDPVDATTGSALRDGGAMLHDAGGSAAQDGAASGAVGATAGDAMLRDSATADETTASGESEAGLVQGDGSATGCPGLFCEDFEKGALDPAVWNAQASGGQTVTVQTKVVAHGRYAVQFHANPNIVSYDFIVTRNAPAALRGHHFGRAYFNVTPKPPAEHTEFLFAGTAGFPKLKYLEVAGIGTAWQLTYVDQIGGGESYASGGNAPDARWVCLEWEFNDAPDQATVFVDGVQSYARDTITFDGVSTGLVGGFTDFGWGYYAWHPATYAFDIYYDDIVLDTKRVGCLAGP
jgi:hypothetical protein